MIGTGGLGSDRHKCLHPTRMLPCNQCIEFDRYRLSNQTDRQGRWCHSRNIQPYTYSPHSHPRQNQLLNCINCSCFLSIANSQQLYFSIFDTYYCQHHRPSHQVHHRNTEYHSGRYLVHTVCNSYCPHIAHIGCHRAHTITNCRNIQ